MSTQLAPRTERPAAPAPHYDDPVARLLHRTRAMTSGLPLAIDDPVTLERVAEILGGDR